MLNRCLSTAGRAKNALHPIAVATPTKQLPQISNLCSNGGKKGL
jgi:hypothetical protein